MEDQVFAQALSALTSAQRRTAVATLAAVLVQNRGPIDVRVVAGAVRDAEHLLFADRNTGTYKAWAKENGLD